MFDISSFIYLFVTSLSILSLFYISSFYLHKRKYSFIDLIIYILLNASLSLLFSYLIKQSKIEYHHLSIIYFSSCYCVCSFILFFTVKSNIFSKVFICLLSLIGFQLAISSIHIISNILDITNIAYSSYLNGGILFATTSVIDIIYLYVIIKPNNELISDYSFKDVYSLFFIFAISSLVLDIFYLLINLKNSIFSLLMSLSTFIYTITLLLISFSYIKQKQSEVENLIIKTLWEEDKRKYQSIIDNNEIIALTIHDLKHQIKEMKEEGLTEQMIDSLQKSIKVRDAYVKSGNSVLDVILYNFYLRAQKSGVTFTSMVNGKLLDFLTEIETYSLIANLLNNALEYLDSKAGLEDKFISFTIKEVDKTVVVHVENLYVDEIKRNLLTTKADKKNHGYGIKSVKRICAKYKGRFLYYIEDNMFQVDAIFPIK